MKLTLTTGFLRSLKNWDYISDAFQVFFTTQDWMGC